MKIIDRLEKSVYSVIENSKKLRKERNETFQSIDKVRKELKNAKDTIKVLRSNINKIEKTTPGYQEKEIKKNKIIYQIQSILSKLDNLII